MAKIIEAKAVISAEDKTGAVFDKIAKKIDGIAKSGKASKSIDAIAKSMERARTQMEAIDRFSNSRGSFDAAQKRLRAAQAAVEAHKAAMSSIAAPNRAAAEGEQKRLARAVDQATRAYESQKSAVFANRSALERAGVPIKEAVTHQQRLKAAIAATTIAFDKQGAVQERRAIASERMAKVVGIGGAALAAGAKVKNMGKSAIVSAAEFDIGIRKQREFVDIPKDVQEGLLIPQAKKIGQDTQFSNLDVVKAQTTAMQGLPASFDGKLRAEVGAGIIESVKNYALVMEADMQRSAEGLRSFLQTTNKDISTKEKAVKEATRATNLMVKTAKLGGMNDEDAQQFFKYAAPTATAAGLSDTTLGALGAVGRRGGLRGDELGVFVRSVSSKLVAPTGKGMDALTTAGIDYNKFTTMPGGLSVANLEGLSKRRFGKGFNPSQVDRLDDILDNPDVVSNKEEFTKQVSEILAESFDKKKSGETKAQDSAKIAKMVGDFHKMSTESVDAEGLLNAIMTNPKMSIALLNAMFTDKHGGKGSILASKWGEFQTSKAELDKVGQDPDFAKRKADEIMGGLGGAFERLKGSTENLTLAIGNAMEPLARPGFDKLGNAIDWVSNLPGPVLGAGAAAGAGASIFGAGAIMSKLMGGFGLSASALALDASAAALTAAAGALGAPGVVGKAGAVAAASTAAGGGMWAAGAAALPWAGGAAAVGAGLMTLRAAVDDAGYAGLTSGERMRKQRGGSMREMYAREWGHPTGAPVVSDTTTYGTGVGGDKSQTVTANVTGDVKGEVAGRFEVVAGSELISLVESVKQMKIEVRGALRSAGNGPGSTGRSSPDAAAPSNGASGNW
ncbi:hypothetical protein FNL56_13430 [Tardiphaga sp. vice304]|uniref:phage tail tape measure protein n=1 Tax=Tardiphaga sp. vice304 TaxID=2592817 RepID=UPI001161FEFF|nr:phage tail tape measure protein [Tardiphaga sp. vice304]QDM27002.1 hypothetical protein FNL56_13430 [Tardiphaga sp. vice304]